ncbi:MAG: heavy-metal-associated domain-containing protein [Acidimicrobiia bacterium]
MSPSETAGATLVFTVEGMHCASCGLLIDEFVEELPDVSRSITDVGRGRTVVTLRRVPDGDTPARVAATIAEAGYTAHPAP